MIEQVVDTNVLLFFLQNDQRLPTKAARLIEDPTRKTIVSMASLWEISIKASLGKLSFKPAGAHDFPLQLEKQGFEVAPFNWLVMRRAAKLPWLHRDPFDRYLIAEAQERNAPLLSTDEKLDGYEVERVGN